MKETVPVSEYSWDTPQYESRSKYLGVHKVESAMEVFNSKYVLKSLLNQGKIYLN